MSITDQLNDSRVDGNNNEPRLVLDLDLTEAHALRAWLLETELNGVSAPRHQPDLDVVVEAQPRPVPGGSDRAHTAGPRRWIIRSVGA